MKYFEMTKKIIAFLLINLTALFFFFFFYQSKAMFVTEIHEFDNVSIKIKDNKKAYPKSMPTLKVAHAEWRSEEIGKWFDSKTAEIDNPINNESSYILKNGQGTVTLSYPGGKQFISFIGNTSREDLKPIGITLNKITAHRFVENWLTYKGRLPWDAVLSSFKPITRIKGSDSSETVGFDIEYMHEYEGYQILDDLIKLEITQNKVLSYFRQWSRIIGPLDKPKKILTQRDILRLFANHIKDDQYKSVEIEALELAFYNPSLYFGSNARYSDILYPAWQIHIQAGGTYIIDAYDGSIKKRY